MAKMIKILFSILCTIGIISICSKVNAASANISANKTTATVGDSVTITVKYNAAAWNLNVSGDGISSASYVGNTDDAKNASTTKTIKLDTSSAGRKTITLKGDVSDGETDVTSKINTSVKITVNAKEPEKTPEKEPEKTPEKEPEKTPEKTPEKIELATITKLVVAGKTYKNPDQDITVKVDNDVANATIEVTTSNGESYTIDKGNTVKLEEGTNMARITLVSGNVYTVRIRRAAKVDDTPNIIEEKPEEEVKVTLKSLLIKAAKSEEEKVELSYTPEFSSEVYEYNVVLDETLADITKLDIEAIASQEDFTVEIVGNEDLKEGENTITITVKSKDGEKTAQYKLLVVKEAQLVMPVVAEPIVEVEQKQEVIKPLWNRTQQILITVFTSIIALMGIIYAVIEYRYKKEEQEIKIPGAGTTYEEELAKQDNISDIPFAKIGFEKESDDKVDVLKDEKEEIEKEEIEESPKKEKKAKRGKHF